jgi:hypothetical protein
MQKMLEENIDVENVVNKKWELVFLIFLILFIKFVYFLYIYRQIIHVHF